MHKLPVPPYPVKFLKAGEACPRQENLWMVQYNLPEKQSFPEAAYPDVLWCDNKQQTEFPHPLYRTVFSPERIRPVHGGAPYCYIVPDPWEYGLHLPAVAFLPEGDFLHNHARGRQVLPCQDRHTHSFQPGGGKQKQLPANGHISYLLTIPSNVFLFPSYPWLPSV